VVGPKTGRSITQRHHEGKQGPSSELLGKTVDYSGPLGDQCGPKLKMTVRMPEMAIGVPASD